jgi:hypothetical protein
VALKKALDSGLDANTLQPKKLMLDSDIDAVLARYTTTWDNVEYSSPTDVEEQTVAQSLRSQALIKLNSARIKLHRYRAFQDVPIFTRRHCDLDQVDQSTPRPLGCSCHTATMPARATMSPNPPNFSVCSSDMNQNGSTSLPDITPTAMKEVPFSDLPAAKTCLRAALSISRAFEALPYPNPMQLPLPVAPPATLSLASLTPAPRTMPSFACCAMQSCYVLLTLCYRSREMQCIFQRSMAADKGLEELYSGVARVLAALQNYAVAFEALNGMTRESTSLSRFAIHEIPQLT